jgi:replicative DNA helicase
MNATDRAISYLKLGWWPVPLPARSKRPVVPDWPNLRVTIENAKEHFNGANNIGLLLGDVSGGLVDIDLDHDAALELAPELLPAATRTFGRKSRPRSHWLYTARGARVEKFQSPDGKMLVELRANSAGGLQTMAPGSVHPSGELVEWDAGTAAVPLTLKPEELRAAVARLSVATLLVASGWAPPRALSFVRSPSPGALLGTPAPVAQRIGRWLGIEAPRAASAPTNADAIKRASAYLARIPGAVSGSGGHQTTWTAALAVVRGFDLSDADAYDLLAREYNPRCSPPWKEVELRHKIANAAAARTDRGYLLHKELPARTPRPAPPSPPANAPTSGPVPAAAPPSEPPAPPPAPPGDWEPPVEFGAFDLPPFPLEALPPELADFVLACSEATQTPPDLVALQALAACSAALAKRVVVEVKPGYREPLNLFVATILPPGERKSAVMREVTAPLIAWESEARAAAAPAIARATQQWTISKKRLDAVTDHAAKAKTKEEREQLELEAQDLAEQHGKFTIPREPRIIADDATPEALGSLLSAHGGRMAIFSAEGGVFSMMAGRYSDSPSLDVYLKAHAGDEIRVDRKGRPSEQVTDPALTLGLAVQPAVLDALSEKPMLRGTGLLARFLYALPTSRIGHRSIDAQPMTDSIRASYAFAVHRLLAIHGDGPDPIILTLSPDALEYWTRYAEELEPQLGEDGELVSIRDWAGKLPGAVARIGAILSILSISYINSPSEQSISISTYIDGVSMVRAIALGRYLVPHARAAFSSMGTDERTAAAKQVLKFAARRRTSPFSRRDVQQHFRNNERLNDAEKLAAALTLLVERNFIREAPQPPVSGPGRRPTPKYEVNPLWVPIPPLIQNPQNAQNEGSTVGEVGSSSGTDFNSRNTQNSPVRERVPGEDDE